jgi:hypothetical protein
MEKKLSKRTVRQKKRVTLSKSYLRHFPHWPTGAFRRGDDNSSLVQPSIYDDVPSYATGGISSSVLKR